MQSEKFTTTSMTISAILGLIKAEDIVISEIQRPFVWKTNRYVNLWIHSIRTTLWDLLFFGRTLMWKLRITMY